MGYHSLTIRPDNTYDQENVEKDAILKSVSLTPYVNEKCKRVSIMAKLDEEKEITLCSLLVGKSESKVLNMPLKKGTKLSLWTEGETDVDALFYELDEEEGEETEEYSDSEQERESKYLGVSVEGGKKVILQEDVPLRALSAALKEPVKKEKTVLFYQTEDGDVPIVTFLPESKETEVLDLEFDPGMEIVLGVKGDNAVDVLFLRGDEEEEEDSFDSEEEEVEGEFNSASDSAEEELLEERSVKEEEEAEEVSEASEKNLPSGTKNLRKRALDVNDMEGEDIQTKKIMLPESLEHEKGESENAKDTENSSPSKESANVDVVSEGIGKLIGKRSLVFSKYTVKSSLTSEQEFEEMLTVRKLSSHPHLKYFSELIKGTREGAVLKATVSKEENGATQSTECILNIGKLHRES
ncbi:hypothetical protein NECID01_0920 [Nematocida sp. AWRm77]|nr:hypothetical protein NECID01_0920 [Nematocida sp. AWRm77]